jgi:hypothetical protein
MALKALIAVAVCAAGALALLIATSDGSGPRLAADWSPWAPDTSDMVEGARAIADHLGGSDEIRSSALELGVAVRPSGGELQFLEGDGLQYDLTPAEQSDRLLRREALELALYSFRYLDDVTMVAVLLPQDRAIFYRPGDLLEQLQVPLDRTLSEAARVDSLTLRNLFEASVRPLRDDRDYLVLVEPDTVD